MNFEMLNSELRSSGELNKTKANHSSGFMEGRMRTAAPKRRESKKSPSSNYFSLESLVVLVCLTVSLLILPLILPPLPPPPITLLLIPVGIFIVLLMLAFIPSDIRDIASYL